MMSFESIEDARRYIEENKRKIRELQMQQAYFNAMCYAKDCALATSDTARSLARFYARVCDADYEVF